MTPKEKMIQKIRALLAKTVENGCTEAEAMAEREWTEGDWREQRVVGTYRANVDCIEIQPELAAALEREGIYNRVVCGDFLSIKPEPIYDLVVMNPPFDLERDIDHVTHAFEFLKPGGELFAIMSAGTEFRETKKAIAFRKLLEENRHNRYDRWLFNELPPGSFKESGTYVNTTIVRMMRK